MRLVTENRSLKTLDAEDLKDESVEKESIGERSGTEVVLLGFLRENARVRLREMSSRARLPMSTVHSMMKRLACGSSIVKKYTALIDFPKLGFNIGCFFIARPISKAGKKRAESWNESGIESLIRLISGNRSINSIYLTSDNSMIIEAWFSSMAELSDFRGLLEEYCRVREHEIIDSVEQEKMKVL